MTIIQIENAMSRQIQSHHLWFMHGGWQCYCISLIELTAEKCNEFLGMYNVHFLGMI